MPGSKVPAAEHTLRILRYMASRRGPVSATAIANALGLPRSSVYHLLAVMQENGFVLHLPRERVYGLGIAAFELSSAYARQEPLARLGRPLLAGLVDRGGESAHLAVLHGRDVLYLVEERAKHRPSLVTDVGVRLPAHLTASGRAILAALPAAQVRALFPTPEAFVDRTGVGPRSLTGLRQVLTGVRRQGYAGEDGEVTPGFASVAAAAHDHTGRPVAGLAVTFAAQDVDPADRSRLARPVALAAAELTRRLGGTVTVR